MVYIKKVQKGIDYIEGNLDFEVSLARVAEEAGMSQWHFQRIFKALTKETLKTYIRSRRLAKSLEKLLTTQQGILQISIASGYESQASFTRAFKKTFGMTPNQYRKLGDKSLFLKKVEFDRDYLVHIQNNMVLEPEIVKVEERTMVGMRTLFFGSDSEKNNIANKIPRLWSEFLPRMSEVSNAISSSAFGIIRPLSTDTDRLEYIAALEVSKADTPPSGMVRMDIPGVSYAKFEHRGRPELLDNTVNFVYSNWLMSSGREHSGEADLEIYGDAYIPNSDQSVIYYAIPLNEV